MLALIGIRSKSTKDIHVRLAETIAERKKILIQWERLFYPKAAIGKKDIHAQLQETIAELKKARQQYGGRLLPKQNNGFGWSDKRAA